MTTAFRSPRVLLALIAGLVLVGGATKYSVSAIAQMNRSSDRFEASYRAQSDSLREAVALLSVRMNNNRPVELGERPVPKPVVRIEAPVVREEIPGRLVLEGIAWSEERPVAMINRKTYQAGDRIGPYVLSEISKRSIIVTGSGGERIEFSLTREHPDEEEQE